jgi:hypothetical protein
VSHSKEPAALLILQWRPWCVALDDPPKAPLCRGTAVTARRARAPSAGCRRWLDQPIERFIPGGGDLDAAHVDHFPAITRGNPERAIALGTCHDRLKFLLFFRLNSACHAEDRGFEPRRSRQGFQGFGPHLGRPRCTRRQGHAQNDRITFQAGTPGPSPYPPSVIARGSPRAANPPRRVSSRMAWSMERNFSQKCTLTRRQNRISEAEIDWRLADECPRGRSQVGKTSTPGAAGNGDGLEAAR